MFLSWEWKCSECGKLSVVGENAQQSCPDSQRTFTQLYSLRPEQARNWAAVAPTSTPLTGSGSGANGSALVPPAPGTVPSHHNFPLGVVPHVSAVCQRQALPSGWPTQKGTLMYSTDRPNVGNRQVGWDGLPALAPRYGPILRGNDAGGLRSGSCEGSRVQ